MGSLMADEIQCRQWDGNKIWKKFRKSDYKLGSNNLQVFDMEKDLVITTHQKTININRIWQI